jgi:SAM-dependent methyltransferase
VSRAGFPDLFSRDASAYAQFRPRYPAALFEWIATLPARRRMALDCATGNGQAAEMLAGHFALVLALDASRPQLRAATRTTGVYYLAAVAESSPVRSRAVDLISVAQAFHWLDWPRFFEEVERIAAPGAALAIWGYGRLQAEPAIAALINRFHDETVGPYWSAQRRLVEEGYRGFALPMEEVTAPPFAIEAQLGLSELLGYLRTWSAVGKYLQMLGQDPVESLEPQLAAVWGDPAARHPIRWPLFVRAGRWRPDRLSPPGRTSP